LEAFLLSGEKIKIKKAGQFGTRRVVFTPKPKGKGSWKKVT